MNTQPSETNDTPRVDAAIQVVDIAIKSHDWLSCAPEEIINPDFARTLERELNEANRRREKAEETLRVITPTLLKGRGCWTHDEIVNAVIANYKELSELRRDKAALLAAVKTVLHVMDGQRQAGKECFEHYKMMAGRLKNEILNPIIEAMNQKG